MDGILRVLSHSFSKCNKSQSISELDISLNNSLPSSPLNSVSWNYSNNSEFSGSLSTRTRSRKKEMKKEKQLRYRLLKIIRKGFGSIGYDFRDVWVLWSNEFVESLCTVQFSSSFPFLPRGLAPLAPTIPSPPYISVGSCGVPTNIVWSTSKQMECATASRSETEKDSILECALVFVSLFLFFDFPRRFSLKN